MTPFRERNPIPIAIVGIVVLFLLLVVAFNAQKLPIIGGGDVYKAAFAESGGLKKGEEVRIAGVKVGEVTGVTLDGAHVDVAFRVKTDSHFGRTTGAAIRIKTLLGQHYLALEPDGPGQLSTDTQIPLSRTESPFQITNAFSDLGTEIGQINTDQLAKAFDTISADFQDAPPNVKTSLDGLSRLSRTIASRDDQITALLDHAKGVTTVLAQRDQQFTKLIDDADLVLREVEQRRAVIHQLLLNTVTVSQQLTGLVRDNEGKLDPALAHLRNVVQVLQKDQNQLDDSVRLLAPFVRVFTNTLGNGRWFDTVVANLPPQGATIAPSNSGSGK